MKAISAKRTVPKKIFAIALSTGTYNKFYYFIYANNVTQNGSFYFIKINYACSNELLFIIHTQHYVIKKRSHWLRAL